MDEGFICDYKFILQRSVFRSEIERSELCDGRYCKFHAKSIVTVIAGSFQELDA